MSGEEAERGDGVLLLARRARAPGPVPPLEDERPEPLLDDSDGGERELLAGARRAAYPVSTRGARRRRGAVLVAAALAVLAGYAVTHPGGSAADLPVEVAADPVRDLGAYGWRLGEDGEPPAVAMGLHRQSVAEVGYAEGEAQVTWDGGLVLPGGLAAWAVLWCDLPPEDPRIEQPRAVLTVRGTRIPLACAGRDGEPPVSRVVPVPVGGPGRLELTGDLPRKGSATIAFYREGALSTAVPQALPARRAAGVSPAPAPPAPVPPVRSAVVDTVTGTGPRGAGLLTGTVQISAGSELLVWAGQPGTVSVRVDGAVVTDDGDEDEQDPGAWRHQQPDLRDGRWMAYLAGEQRRFPLPEEVLPAPGERREVTVQVRTEGLADDVQVVLTRARTPGGDGRRPA